MSMGYSPTIDKDVRMLLSELQSVYNNYPEYHNKPLIDMIRLFAADDFFNLHFVAVKYLELI